LKGKISHAARYAEEHPSAIREIMNVVSEFKSHPERFPRPLIYFGGGWPQDDTPPVLKQKLLEVINDHDSWIDSIRYGPTRGKPNFLDGIVNYEEKVFGRKGVDENELLAGSGSTELTAAFMMAVTDPGDEIILTQPSYLNYPRQIQIEFMLGAHYKEWPLIKDHKFAPDIEELKEMITDKTRMLVITAPGNPDGQVPDDELMNAVNDLAEDHGFWVVVDVAYRAFFFDGIPKYFQRPRRENEIWMASLSKEFRIPGWRIAYSIADAELTAAVTNIEQARVLCANSMVQNALAGVFNDNDALKSVKQYYDEGVVKYKDMAEYTVKTLNEKIQNLGVLEPKGGFYVFFDASHYSNDSKKMCADLLDEYQVALAPGKDFGMEGWLRLSYAPIVEERETLVEGLDRMAEFFAKRQK